MVKQLCATDGSVTALLPKEDALVVQRELRALAREQDGATPACVREVGT